MTGVDARFEACCMLDHGCNACRDSSLKPPLAMAEPFMQRSALLFYAGCIHGHGRVARMRCFEAKTCCVVLWQPGTCPSAGIAIHCLSCQVLLFVAICADPDALWHSFGTAWSYMMHPHRLCAWRPGLQPSCCHSSSVIASIVASQLAQEDALTPKP